MEEKENLSIIYSRRRICILNLVCVNDTDLFLYRRFLLTSTSNVLAFFPPNLPPGSRSTLNGDRVPAHVLGVTAHSSSSQGLVGKTYLIIGDPLDPDWDLSELPA